MLNARGFKKRSALAALLIIIIAYSVWQILHFSPFEELVVRKEQVNASTMLYVTEGSAGATTKNVYQYYLVPFRVAESDARKGIGSKYVSFLATSDDNVKIEIDNSTIHLTVKGDIYRFTNAASYSTTIYLTSSPF